MSPYVNTFRGTEAIFEFHPRSEMSQKLSIFAYFCIIRGHDYKATMTSIKFDKTVIFPPPIVPPS